MLNMPSVLVSASKVKGKEHSTNLQPNIVWYFSILYQPANEREICVASSRICNLDFFYSALHKGPKEDSFLFDGHWISKGLVPIAEISRQPYRRLGTSFGGPLTVLKIQWSVRFVLLGRIRSTKCQPVL